MSVVVLVIIGVIGALAVLYSIYLEQKKAEERYVFPDHETRVRPMPTKEE